MLQIAAKPLAGKQTEYAGQRLLIGDDNATNWRNLALRTGKRGMMTHDEATPADALCWLQRPDMDGISLAREIRKVLQALPLILFSSLGLRETDSDLGLFRAYLAKLLRILLAEDNLVNQKLAMRLMEQMGYRADMASNGPEALESVACQTYDVALMDVQMPVIKRFRRAGGHEADPKPSRSAGHRDILGRGRRQHRALHRAGDRG